MHFAHEVKLVEETIDSGYIKYALIDLSGIRHTTAMALISKFLTTEA